MKTAKANKILILFVSLVLCLVSAFVLLGAKPVSAAETVTTIFEYGNDSTHENEDIISDGTDLVIPMSNAETVNLKNDVVVNDFAVSAKLPQEFTKITLTLNTSAYDVNGSNVDNKLIIEKFVDDTMKATYNGSQVTMGLGSYSSTQIYTVNFKVENDYLNCYLGGYRVGEDDVKFRVESEDKTVAKFSITIECASDCQLKINAIDQKASDVSGNFKQTFDMTDGKYNKVAYPRLEISKSLVNFDDTNNPVIMQGAEVPLGITAYSVMGKVEGAEIDLLIKQGSAKQNDKTVSFNAPGMAKVEFVDGTDNQKVFEAYDMKVIAHEKTEGVDPAFVDTTAPVYVDDQDLYDSFVKSYTDKLYEDKEKNIFISVGSGKKLELPSLKSLVYDDGTNYENLTYTVYYKTPTASNYTTSMEVPIETAGDYLFYVLFKDKNGNQMNPDDFIKTDEDDSNIQTYGDYEKYIFRFTILDNSEFSIKSATSQVKGYIGVSYNASDFKISASSYTSKYQLFYSKTNDENSTWVEIPASSTAKENDNVAGFTYDDIKSIAYNGKLNFTADRAGYYKIKCTITSLNSERTASAESTVTISAKPRVVKPDSQWLQNNVWSVVFLSVGTLCLIGIIVLLCIKPKDKND